MNASQERKGGMFLRAFVAAAVFALAAPWALAETPRDKAERFLRDFQKRASVSAEAKKAAVDAFTKDPPVAAREAADLIESCLESVTPEFKKAQEALRAGDTGNARALFEKAKKTDDAWLRAAARFGAAMSDFRAGRFADAETEFGEVAEKERANTPRDVEAAFQRALSTLEAALHETPDKEQPLKDKALGQFRKFL